MPLPCPSGVLFGCPHDSLLPCRPGLTAEKLQASFGRPLGLLVRGELSIQPLQPLHAEGDPTGDDTGAPLLVDLALEDLYVSSVKWAKRVWHIRYSRTGLRLKRPSAIDVVEPVSRGRWSSTSNDGQMLVSTASLPSSYGSCGSSCQPLGRGSSAWRNLGPPSSKTLRILFMKPRP